MKRLLCEVHVDQKIVLEIEMMDVSELQRHLARLSEVDADVRGLEHTLGTLPGQLTHRAMVPLGQVAFMPGTLYRTNEILVKLGGGLAVWRSCAQAKEILARKSVALRQEMEQTEYYLNTFQSSVPMPMGSSAEVQRRPENLLDERESAQSPESIGTGIFAGEVQPVEIREKPETAEERKRRVERERKQGANVDSKSTTVPRPGGRESKKPFDPEVLAKLAQLEDEFVQEHGANYDHLEAENFLKSSKKTTKGRTSRHVTFVEPAAEAPSEDTFARASQPRENRGGKPLGAAFTGEILERSTGATGKQLTSSEAQNDEPRKKVSLFKQRREQQKKHSH